MPRKRKKDEAAANIASDPVEPNDAAIDGEDDVFEEDEMADGLLDMLFRGKVTEILPPEELSEFHDFLREEALRRRRFAVSFRLDCGCLAWIGYALTNVVTHEDGIEFNARPTQSFAPNHEPDVEHPEGPTEDPPDDFVEWPIWPLEIYQDELQDEDDGLDDE